MGGLKRFLNRLVNVLRVRRAESELARELASHLGLLEDEFERRGLSRAEAHLAARRQFGGLEQAKELHRDARGFMWLDDTVRDVRYAVRILVRTPAFAAVAILTLALGIGANTAVFSVVNSLSLRPLPVEDPQQLVLLAAPTERSGSTTLVADRDELNATWTNPVWEEVRRRHLFEDAFAWSVDQFNLATHGEAEFVQGVWASAHLFETLGVHAILGRTFADADDQVGAQGGPVAVISYAFWQRRFGGSPNAVGQTLFIERVPFTVVGVTPRGFFGPDVGRFYDIAIPLGTDPIVRGLNESRLQGRDWWWLKVMARLRKGQTQAQATNAIRSVQPSIREATLPDWPADWQRQYLQQPFAFVAAANGESNLRRAYQSPLLILLGLVALVLGVACASLANLFLARAIGRRDEWNVRLSLGASRGRLIRFLFTEHLLIAGIGAAAGLVVARWAAAWLVGQISARSDPAFLNLSFDWRVLCFTTLVAAVAVLLFGCAPMLWILRAEAGTTLRGHVSAGGRYSRPVLSDGVIVAQIALSAVLLVVTALLVRTLIALEHIPLGVDQAHVVLATIDIQHGGPPVEDRLGTYERIRERVLTLPGIAAAGISHQTLLTGGATGNLVAIDGTSGQHQTLFHEITPDWLATYGQPLRSGRDITPGDNAASAPIALVNEAFARTFLGGSNPIGHTLRYTIVNQPIQRQIVGVVANAVYRNLREPIPPTVYIPLEQFDESTNRRPPSTVSLGVRVIAGPSGPSSRLIGDAVSDVVPNAAITFRTLSEQVNNSVRQERLIAWLAGLFGALALLLAAIGLYGVTAFTVHQRRREIGIRVALGAAKTSIVHLFIRRMSRLVAAGIGIGVLASLWVSRLISALLYGVTASDPVSVVGGPVLLAAVAIVAATIPAWRSASVDAAVVLREQ